MADAQCSECHSEYEPLIVPCSSCPRRLCWLCATRTDVRRGAPATLREYVIKHLEEFKGYVCPTCQSLDEPEGFVPRSLIGQLYDHELLTAATLRKHNVATTTYLRPTAGTDPNQPDTVDPTAGTDPNQPDTVDLAVGLDQSLHDDSFHETSTLFPAREENADDAVATVPAPNQGDPAAQSTPPTDDENERQLEALQRRLTLEQQRRNRETPIATTVGGASATDGGPTLPAAVQKLTVPATAGTTATRQVPVAQQNQPPPQGGTQGLMTQKSFEAFLQLTQQQFQLQDDRYQKLFQFAVSQATNAGSQPPPPAPQRSGSGSAGIVPKFAMPKCTIPEFSGQEPLDYLAWRQRFTLWVEGYDPTYKMACLLPVLKGQALKKVKGLGTTAEAYPLALKVLDDAYGDVNLAIHAAEKRIKEAPDVPSNLHKFEEFVDANRNAYSFLKQQGLSDDRLSALVPLLVSKLPRHVCEKVLLSLKKREWGSVSIPELLDCLEDVRKLSAAASVYSTTTAADPKRAKKPVEKKSGDREPTMMYSNTQPDKKKNDYKKTGQKFQPKPKSNASGPVRPPPKESSGNGCVFCDRPTHLSKDCRTFGKPQERRDRIFELRKCFRCLQTGHRARECKQSKPCTECGGNGHHSLIHNEEWSKRKTATATQLAAMHKPEPPPTEMALLSSTKVEEATVMATFEAEARCPVAKSKQTILVLCDSASTVTCVRDDVAQALQLPTLEVQTMNISAFGTKTTTRMKVRQVRFTLEAKNGYRIIITAWTVPCISAPAVLEPLPWTTEQEAEVRRRYPDLLNMPPKQTERRRFDLVLGLDFYNAIMHEPGAVVHHLFNDTKMVVNETPLGPIMYGHLKGVQPSSRKASRRHMQLVNLSTNEDIERLFGFEVNGIEPWELQDEHTAAVEQVRASLSRMSNGGYEMRFPLRFPLDDLPDGKGVAISRLHHWYKSLKGPNNDQARVTLYDNQIMQLLEAGILERVDEAAPPQGPVHYLPHFGVFKESATTSVRPVVDPSQPTEKGKKALNEYFYSGPNLLGNLMGYLIRCRLPETLIICDIAKAFYMLGLNRAHADLTRILWLKNPKLPPTPENRMVLRLTRIPFGFAPSPFLLHYTLAHHLSGYKSKVARTMEKNIYVDNVALHATTTADAMAKYKESKSILADAAMNLRQYVSNDLDFNQAIPEEDRGDAAQTKLLGVRWDVSTDDWSVCKAPTDIRAARTKRDVARHAASLWDPLGIASPVILKMRLVLRATCLRELKYDEELPPDLQEQWKEAAEEVENLHCFSYQRRVIKVPTKPFHLVAFTDASEVGHGFCVYAVQDGEANLLYARSSGNPCKPKLLEVPKTELLGLIKGAQALKFILGVLPKECEVLERRVYTDSLIAVHQVYTTRTDLGVYVRNRVQKIREIMRDHDVTVHHVPGVDNPADYASRSLAFAELISTSWLHGPAFLCLDPNTWPKWEGAQLDPYSWTELYDKTCEAEKPEDGQDDGPEEEMTNRQMAMLCHKAGQKKKKNKKDAIMPFETGKEEPGPFNIMASKCKSVAQALNQTIYCQRFIDGLRKLPVPSTLYPTAEEKRRARLGWTRSIQKQAFKETLSLLRQNKTNQVIRQLDLFLDAEGDVRIGGRLQNANIPFDARHPHLLPSCHPWTRLLILESHVAVNHYRTQQTLVQLRRRYWIADGKTVVENVIRDCFECRRSGGQTYAPPSYGPYPLERVDVGVAGRHAGIDICGPFNVLTEDHYAPAKAKERPATREKKIWVLVYTCLVTKFVDLEILPDYSGLASAMALRRIFSRRGVPRSIYSDWGSNLLFALGHVQQHTAQTNPAIRDQEKLASFLADKEVAVKQIPVRAPYSGGAWEAMVRLVKNPLHKIFWKKTVDYDTFHTTLCEVGATINSRPLTYVGRTRADGLLITPSLFIAPSTRLALPPSKEEYEDQKGDPTYEGPSAGSNDKTLARIAPKLLKMLSCHWKIFQQAYFQHLEEDHRNKFKATPGQHRRQPEPGDVCLIKDVTPRNTWAICRVTETLPASDGKVRVVKVATKNTKPGRETPRHVRELIPIAFTEAADAELQPTVKPHQIDPNLDEEADSEDEDGGATKQITVALQKLDTTLDQEASTSTNDVFRSADLQLETLATQLVRQKEDEENEGVAAEDYVVNTEERANTMAMMATVSEDAISASPPLRRSSKSPYLHMLMLTFLFSCASGMQTGSGSLDPEGRTPRTPAELIRLSPIQVPLPTAPATLQGYQLCVETRSGGQAILLPSTQESCSLPPARQEEEEIQVTVWTPSDELPSTTAIRCYLETVRIVTYTSVFFGYGIVSENTGHLNTTSVPPDLCRRVWRTKYYKNDSLVKLDDETWATQRNLTDLYKWCCFAKVNEETNFVITVGTVASAQHDALSSDLGSLGGCRIQDLCCRQPSYTIVWDQYQLADYCPFRRRGTYAATASKNLLVIPDLQAALTVLPTLETHPFVFTGDCLPAGTYLTKEGPAVLYKYNRDLRDFYTPDFDANDTTVDRAEGTPSMKLLKKMKAAKDIFDAMDPVNAKLHYLAAILEDAMDSRFATLFYQFCLLANQQLATSVQLIHVDPTRGIRALLGREDVAATLHGDVAYVHKCHAVKIAKLHMDHHVRGEPIGTCREFIPVELDDGKLYFIPPGSRDLVPTSPLLPCSEVKPAILPSKEDLQSGLTEWGTIAGRVHVTQLTKHTDYNYTRLTFEQYVTQRVK